MKLPQHSHLQIFILRCLIAGNCSGVELRAKLKLLGQDTSLAAFYQLMSRMEEGGLIEGSFHHSLPIRQRQYRILEAGKLIFEEAQSFYAAIISF